MFNLDTSIHIVGHVLVAVCVEELPDWWHPLYATSLIVPVFMRFQLLWLVPVYVRYFQPLWRSWSIIYLRHFGDHGPLYIFIMEIPIYVYCTWRWPHMWYHVSCLFMAIVLLCIQDCYMYLQLYYCTMLIGWLVFYLGSFITPLHHSRYSYWFVHLMIEAFHIIMLC